MDIFDQFFERVQMHPSDHKTILIELVKIYRNHIHWIRTVNATDKEYQKEAEMADQQATRYLEKAPWRPPYERHE